MRRKLRTKLLLTTLLLAAALMFWYVPTDLDSWTSYFIQNAPASYLQDTGTINIYFCPQEECESAFIAFVNSAQTSLHCALYEIDLPSIQQALLEKQKNIEVQIVTDSDYLDQFNHSFVTADRSGLMHNKFCIVDGVKISTGSMNPTDNDAHKNNNNLLLIQSAVLAENYEEEFQEMWQGVYKKGTAVRNSQIKLGNITIENYFCPDDHCAQQVKEKLESAQRSIDFMTFSFTHEGIANALLFKNQEGIPIRGVMETTQISEYSKFQVLQYQGIDVHKDGNKRNMHHKVFIIDGETVVTGSFNPTAGGDERNDENVLIIKDKEIAQLFLDEFEKVYAEAQPES